ncbi:MAG: ABC transporter substrate-binding protein [Deltaproteobacteria bacterium]|nr:ABC transporter substrate-binding protein [Deltaproteobacteria bacterium]
MTKKVLVWILLTFFVANVSIAEAQQPKKIPRIGGLSQGSSPPAAFLRSGLWRQELAKLGYVEGKTIAFENRFAEEKPDRLPGLAAELVRLKVDVIVAISPPEIRAAKEASSTIPIVMLGTPVDPVAAGFVASLARPGGNVTGLASLGGELHGKRLELLKEVSPRISLVAILWPRPQQEQQLKEIEPVAQFLGIQIQSFIVGGGLDGLESAFSAISKKRPNALLVAVSRLIMTHRARVIDFATKRRLPAMYDSNIFVEDGGLMSYGVDWTALFRRAAIHVDKILKGTKPADIPVEQPMKFEFIINLKAAKAIGLTIPPNVLVQANQVIK